MHQGKEAIKVVSRVDGAQQRVPTLAALLCAATADHLHERLRSDAERVEQINEERLHQLDVTLMHDLVLQRVFLALEIVLATL